MNNLFRLTGALDSPRFMPGTVLHTEKSKYIVLGVFLSISGNWTYRCNDYRKGIQVMPFNISQDKLLKLVQQDEVWLTKPRGTYDVNR